MRAGLAAVAASVGLHGLLGWGLARQSGPRRELAPTRERVEVSVLRWEPSPSGPATLGLDAPASPRLAPAPSRGADPARGRVRPARPPPPAPAPAIEAGGLPGALAFRSDDRRDPEAAGGAAQSVADAPAELPHPAGSAHGVAGAPSELPHPAGPAQGGAGAASELHRPPQGVAGLPAGLHQRLARSALACYPAAAQRFRLEGTASLSFCLSATGALASLELVRSSGSPVLDRAATGCVVQGAMPLPFGPGCFEVPVRFSR